MREENKHTPLGKRLNNPGAKIPKEERLEDIRQNFKVVDTVPTKTPRTQAESIVIYNSGATYRLYVYVETTGTWKYTTLS